MVGFQFLFVIVRMNLVVDANRSQKCSLLFVYVFQFFFNGSQINFA